MAQVTERLPSKSEALSSNPSTTHTGKKEKRKRHKQNKSTKKKVIQNKNHIALKL
jgi:hypothetical protein